MRPARGDLALAGALATYGVVESLLLGPSAIRRAVGLAGPGA